MWIVLKVMICLPFLEILAKAKDFLRLKAGLSEGTDYGHPMKA
jgi:hypothetical protein